MSTFKEIYAKKVAELQKHNRDSLDPRVVNLAPEQRQTYERLKAYASGKTKPSTMSEVAQAVADAQDLAPVLGVKAAQLGGPNSKLTWPMSQFDRNAPGALYGVAPYVPHFGTIMQMTFPKPKDAPAVNTPAPKAEEKPESKADALVELKNMMTKAGKDLTSTAKDLPNTDNIKVSVDD